MPKQEQRAEVNSFVKGLITEASALNFPPDAMRDGENFELKRDGTIRRRFGMDYENEFVFRDSGIPLASLEIDSVNSFRWLTVGGDPTVDFLVLQINQTLYFYDLFKEPLSSGYVGQVAIGSFPIDKRWSFAALEGNLVVVAGTDSIAVIDETFAVTFGRILTRDVWGLEETVQPQYETDVSFRGALDPIHYYNLQNQSWGIPRKSEGGINSDPVVYYTANLGKAPSNSEQVWAGLQFQAVATGQVPFERMYSNLYEETLGAKVSTAKGYFIIDALRRGQSRTEQWTLNKVKYPELSIDLGPIPNDLTTDGASTITSFAGRVFYAGFNGEVMGGDKRSPEYSNYIFFSQVVKNKTDFFKCYQDGDPTSRDSTDLVDTDGGFIRVSGAKDILAIRNLETSLIVISSNGVWSITGGSDFGFSATNYKVTKISALGGLSESSVIVEGGTAYFWSEDGIYQLGRNQLGDLAMTNISINTIQKFYEDIPTTSRMIAQGNYDILDKKIRWIYREGAAFSSESLTKELVLDTTLGSFSINRVYKPSTNAIEIGTLFRSSSFIVGDANQDVYSETNQVVASSDNVVIPQTAVQSGIQSTRYLALVVAGGEVFITFAQYNNLDFVDFEKYDGIGNDAYAFVVTGSQTGGDGATKKQIPYLVFHMNRTEQGVDTDGTPLKRSSCRVRYQWNFANGAKSKKWTTTFQVYRYVKAYIPSGPADDFDNGFSILTTKNKVRGMGRAFTMFFETEAKKDCQIIGWNLTLTGNQLT